ncbi:MAG: transcriptional repressor [Bacteroidales bacterium]|nr:transcriptional repressor [Bacteroidales bacterium]
MSDEKNLNAAMAVLTQYLLQHKLRRTPERFAILEKVMATNSHFGIDDLHATLEAEGYHVSLSTVYNTMTLLVDAGLARRHIFGKEPPKYEKLVGPASHHHLVCTHCGKVREIKDAEIDALLSSRRYGKFHPMYTDLYIYGICARCSRRKKKE